MLCVYDFFKARILGDDPGEEVLLVFFFFLYRAKAPQETF